MEIKKEFEKDIVNKLQRNGFGNVEIPIIIKHSLGCLDKALEKQKADLVKEIEGMKSRVDWERNEAIDDILEVLRTKK